MCECVEGIPTIMAIYIIEYVMLVVLLSILVICFICRGGNSSCRASHSPISRLHPLLVGVMPCCKDFPLYFNAMLDKNAMFSFLSVY
jgi:hypothetical protein